MENPTGNPIYEPHDESYMDDAANAEIQVKHFIENIAKVLS